MSYRKFNQQWKVLGERAYPFLEIYSFEGESVYDDGESDEVVVRCEFRGSERRQCIEEKCAASLELADGYHVEPTVDL